VFCHFFILEILHKCETCSSTSESCRRQTGWCRDSVQGLICPQFRIRSKMLCEMTNPVAQLRKSWSMARVAFCVQTRPGTIELSEDFLGFGIDGKHGIARLKILVPEIVCLSKLCVTERGSTSREDLRHIVQSETIFDKPATYDRKTDRRPHRRQFFGNYG
jgi:hypothetical protein